MAETKIDQGISPQCPSTPSYTYSPGHLDEQFIDYAQTKTDKACTRAALLPNLEILLIYAESMHDDRDTSADSNQNKKMTLTVLYFKNTTLLDYYSQVMVCCDNLTQFFKVYENILQDLWG